MKSMMGRVVAFDGRYFQVECPSAPPHLRELNLTRSQLADAVVGDNVRLEYTSTSRMGLWSVTEVLT